ncbi:TPA: ATP-binding protein [Streptococcus suis]|nr:ATP-binding protein [Streptococcus suis]
MSLLTTIGVDDQVRQSAIWDIHDNLILKKDGSVSAIYRIPSKVINSVDDEAKEDFKQLVFSALSNLRTYNDFNIRMIPVNQELLSKFYKLSLDIDWESPINELADEVLNSMVYNLKSSLREVFEYKYYLVVPLKSIHVSVDLKSVLNQSYQTVRNKALSYFGFGEALPVNWYDKYKNQKEVLDNAVSLLEARPLDTEENIFINRLQYLRGMEYEKDFEIEMVESSIENLDDVNIEFEHVNVMKLSNFDKASYIAMLPLDKLPENVSYIHLQEEIQTLPFPVEVSYLTQFSLPKGVFSLLGKATRARQRLKNTMEEADETDTVQKTSVIRSRFLLEDIQERFDEDEPMVSYLNTLIITGESIEDIKSRFEILSSHLNQMGIGVVRANADQLYLFYKNMIGSVLDTADKNFIQSMTLEAFCENLFFITRKVGTDVGFYIGRVDNQIASWQGDYQTAIQSSNNPVYTNLLQANKLKVDGKVTNNPHVAIIGETGTGKSFLTKLLFTYHSMLKSKILYIDPKAEMRKQYQKVLEKHRENKTNESLQRYIESIDFVTLDAKNPENYGVLDPIVFLTGAEAVDLADSMIDSLLGKDNNPIVQAGYLESIDKIMKKRAEGQKVGMQHVFEDMQSESQEQETRNAGKLLERIVKNSILSLCFSDGQNDSISLDNKVTILEITGLDLPKAGTNHELTKTQQKSLTVMYALGYFCKRFGERDKSEETILFFDEAWFFNSTSVGRSILMELKRIGRSFNNFMVYITQSVHDLATTDDSTGFGTVFAFLEKTEIDAVLDYLKIVKTKETRSWIGNMTTGQCIYFDTFGRKERITVDGMFPEIAELFDTVETKLQSVA